MSTRRKTLDLKKYSYCKLALEGEPPGANMEAACAEPAELIEEGMGAQPDETTIPSKADMKSWFAEIKTEIAAKTAVIMTSIEELKGDVAEHGRRIFEVETRAEANSADIKDNQEKLNSMQEEMERLKEKMEDLENRSRHHNLRFRGIPEGLDYSDCSSIVTQISAMLLREGAAAMPADQEVVVKIARAHRVFGPRVNNLPKDIIACYHEFAIKDKVASIARQQITWQWLGMRS